MDFKILSKLSKLATFLNLGYIRYRLVYIGISLSLLLLISNEIRYALLLIPYAYYIIKMHKDLIIMICVVMALYGCSVYIQSIDKIENEDEYKVTIIDDINHKEKTSFKGKIRNSNLIVYLNDKNESLSPGDELTIKGSLEEVKQSTIPHTFSYKNYLLSKKVKHVLYTSKYEVVDNQFHINDIQLMVNKYISKYMPLTKRYVKTFVLANKEDFDDGFIEDVNSLGVSHLFAVSGLHIGLVILMLNLVLKKIHFSQPFIEYSISLFLIAYMIITSFSPSVVRASLMYIMLIMNSKMKLNLSTIDILSFIYIVLLIINPYYYYNVGFLLSFIVTISILLSRYILMDKTQLQSIFIITIIASLMTIPITSSLNNSINLTTLIINIVLIYYMTYIVLPFGYITFIIRITDYIYNIFIKGFEYIIRISSNIEIFTINITINNAYFIMIYYIFIILSFTSFSRLRLLSKYSFMMLFFVIILLNQDYLSLSRKVTILDVFGDSIMVKDSFNKCNILIDTGVPDDYNSVIQYLKGEHIKRLDYLIITHYHSDHSGEFYDILNAFEVVYVIDQYNVSKYDEIECGTLKMKFFHSKSLKDENNDSVVFQLIIENKTYLFTGDIELEREKLLLEDYNMKSDYFKSPHHGSITSSTEELIDHVDPQEVFITCYEGNRHGHPHEEVIKRYNDRGIYINRIDKHGTIEMIYVFGFEFKKIHNR